MTGFIHMDLDATKTQFRALDATGTKLSTDWGLAKDIVEFAERGIGQDLIAERFLGRYRPVRDEVVRVADSLPGSITTLTTGGRVSALDYRDTDGDGAAGFRGPR